MLLELQLGLTVERKHVAVVRKSEDDKTTAIFTAGQDAAHDGFRVEKPYDQVVDLLRGPEDEIAPAAQALLAKLDAAADELQRLAQLAYDQGVPYNAPHFADEMHALRTALEQAE